VGHFRICYIGNPVNGDQLSGIQVQPHPPPCPNVTIAGSGSNGWINAGDSALVVHVHCLPACILLTLYGDQPAQIKIEAISLPNKPDNSLMFLPNKLSVPDPPAFELLAHVAGRGDVMGNCGSWLGVPGSKQAIEGICIRATEEFLPIDLSYQIILGYKWVSPWFKKNQFCGSRSFGLPLLGFRLRLRGEASKKFRLSYFGTFIGGVCVGPIGNGRFCKSPDLTPVEALMIDIIPISPAGLARERMSQSSAAKQLRESNRQTVLNGEIIHTDVSEVDPGNWTGSLDRILPLNWR
jgi:hypothetical protein